MYSCHNRHHYSSTKCLPFRSHTFFVKGEDFCRNCPNYSSPSPCTTRVKFCFFNPTELLATQMYTAESFTIRFWSVCCNVSLFELPGAELRTWTFPSWLLLLISTNETGGTASTMHSRRRLVVASFLIIPERNQRTGVTVQNKVDSNYWTLKLSFHTDILNFRLSCTHTFLYTWSLSSYTHF